MQALLEEHEMVPVFMLRPRPSLRQVIIPNCRVSPWTRILPATWQACSILEVIEYNDLILAHRCHDEVSDHPTEHANRMIW